MGEVNCADMLERLGFGRLEGAFGVFNLRGGDKNVGSVMAVSDDV